MALMFNFDIQPAGEISNEFLKRNIKTFEEPSDFVRYLPYGRNANKNEPATLFTDQCGTCSTKHALLKLLAEENNIPDVKLMLGIFKMNASNTPKIAQTLTQNQLTYIPEAHNYLKINNHIVDVTNSNSSFCDFLNDLLEEIEITPQQITDFKTTYHQHYLRNWLTQYTNICYSISELWHIREQCIKDLSIFN